MSKTFSWLCPHCGQHATIREYSDTSRNSHVVVNNSPGKGGWGILTEVIVCPNTTCKQPAIEAHLCPTGRHNFVELDKKKKSKSWYLLPESIAKQFPEYIPKQLIKDYQESCAILHLSPNASGTLARRCLQGILRDFYKVNPSSLYNEIQALKDKIDPELWSAIDAVRKVGNIGAHMQENVNLIIDIDAKEAEKLVRLIEILFSETYIRRFQREKDLTGLKQLAEDKEKQKAFVATGVDGGGVTFNID